MGTITVSGLGKAYKKYPSRRARLAEWVLPFGGPRHTLSWILEDINFTIHPGEAVGLIGINGAGKSTLLKMITGTTQPTTGSVQIQGRVAAMLELGMGFHPDFTGRQNAFMAGQILGYSAEDMHRLLPSIVEFSEVGDYIDQPVRVYSSGMQMRVAFSVATALRPDVLIVDEALSVGDAYFQHKSFERIREFRRQGTTLLMVSHDKSAIQSICDRAILLDGGRIGMEGSPQAVMDYYNGAIAERDTSDGTVRQVTDEGGLTRTISGTGEAIVTAVSLVDMQGQALDVADVDAPVTLAISVRAQAPVPRMVLGFMLKDRLGLPIYGTNTHHLHCAENDVQAGEDIDFRFHFRAALGEGTYSVSISISDASTHLNKNYEWRDLALVFEVVNLSKDFFLGTTYLAVRHETVRHLTQAS
jgi:lipopolysaccharide transport system ATP-binding protein